MDNLPFSQACENNKAFILAQLETFFADCDAVLEIASGTGQHACHFAQHMPWLQWQPTDRAQQLEVLTPRCRAYAGDNLRPPVALDVTDDPWPVAVPGGIFSANSLHIMPASAMTTLFERLTVLAPPGCRLAIYGPFNYQGQYTSPSNARFDQWLAQQDPRSAIRDFETVDALAAQAGFGLVEDVEMPANNRLLLWEKPLS